jgi:hypothetical protein
MAVNDGLRATDFGASRHLMPGVEYDGEFDPQNIPATQATLRQRADVAGHRAGRTILPRRATATIAAP